MFVLIVSLLSFVALSTQEGCPPKPDTIPELDAAAYLGEWYEVMGIPTRPSPADAKCIRAAYGPISELNITVHNVQLNGDGSFQEICGFAYIPDPTKPGDIEVIFPGAPGPGNYWLLDTDYENWSAVYACNEFGGMAFELGWVLTRERNPSEDIIEQGLEVFREKGLPVDKLIKRDQGDDCFYDVEDSCADAFPSN